MVLGVDGLFLFLSIEKSEEVAQCLCSVECVVLQALSMVFPRDAGVCRKMIGHGISTSPS